MPEIFQYSFMVRALIAGGLMGIICPTLGTFLVLRRLSLIADTLSHVALTGVAAGIFLQVSPPVTAVIASASAAVLIEWLRSSGKLYGEAALAVFLYAALALAVVLVSLGKGLNANLFAYLFGSVVTVGESDIVLIGGLAILVLALVICFYNELVQTTFDQELAQVGGLPVGAVNLLLAVLTGVTVALAMRVVGVLLVGALIVVPVLASLQVSRSFRGTLLLAVALGFGSVLAGLVLAYYWNLAAGGAIVLLSLLLLAATAGLRQALDLLRRIRGTGRSSASESVKQAEVEA